MSRSYKKYPAGKVIEKDVKKMFNRRIRRSNKNKYVDIPDGNAYRKCNPQWELCDERYYCTWDDFKLRNSYFFDNEKKMYAYWKRFFGSK